jgi:hypothetical protein
MNHLRPIPEELSPLLPDNGEQSNRYAELLQQTQQLLNPDELPQLQVRADLREQLRQKVAAHQTALHKNGIGLPSSKPNEARPNKLTIFSRFDWASAAAVAVVAGGLWLGQFALSPVNTSVMAQDTLSLQHTIWRLDNDTVMPLRRDTMQ